MKLHFASYTQKLKSVTLIFDLLHHALQELSDTAFRRFMEVARASEGSNLGKMLSLLADDPEQAETLQFIKRHHKRKMSAELPVTPSTRWAEYKGHAQLGLRASELILRVAFFEAFMKQIHQHALLANPEIMARVKPNRPVVLKELFRGGFDRLKAEELSRQVREADRLPTKGRAKFFIRYLRLPWGDDLCIDRITELTELRHKIVHGSPDRPVLDREIQDARTVFVTVPRKCFDRACELYPSNFAKK